MAQDIAQTIIDQFPDWLNEYGLVGCAIGALVFLTTVALPIVTVWYMWERHHG